MYSTRHGKLQALLETVPINLFWLAYKAAAKSVFKAKLDIMHKKENRELFFDNLDSNLSDPK